MNHRNALVVILVLVILTCTGCAKVNKSWRWILSGVDPAPTIDLNTKELSDENHERLAQAFAPVDMHLQHLYRTLNAKDSYPDDAWIELTMRNYPWLGGLLTVDTNSTILLERTGAGLKPVNPNPLVDFGDKWFDREPLAFVDTTDFGPEVYVANAFFESRNWQGLIVVHFDFRTLMQTIGYSGPMIVLSENSVLWAGNDEQTAQELLKAPWKELVAGEVQGETTAASSGKTFIWFARYFGGIKLFYLLATEPESSSWF